MTIAQKVSLFDIHHLVVGVVVVHAEVGIPIAK